MNAIRFSAVSLVVSLAALAAGKESKVVDAADVAWQELDAKHPGGPKMAVLTGDPKKGPVEFMLKIPAGMDAGLHTHSSDYTAVLVQGAQNHYKDSPADGHPLAVGSHWFQPGKVVHGDVCTGTTDCVLVISMPGKFDMIPAKAKAAEPEKK